MREKFKKLYPLTINKDDFEHYRTIKSIIDKLECSKTQFYLLKEENIIKIKQVYYIQNTV